MDMDWERHLWGGWTSLARTAVVGVCAYVVLVVLLRLSGKRTLSKFNAFDFVVTIAIGSTLASVLVSQGVALAQGIAAFVVLLGLQWVIAWLSVRSDRVRGFVRGEPTLLFHRGDFIERALRRERVTKDELEAAARAEGIASLGDVEAAVLETDGSITVVRRHPEARPSAMSSVRGYPGDTGDDTRDDGR